MRAASRKISTAWRSDSSKLVTAKQFASITLVLAFLIGTFVASPAQSAESCTKSNAVKVVSGTKFVCKKVGSKLEWVKQGSNSVVNNQPSAPAPTISVLEWSKCSPIGRVSGSGPKGLVCVKYQGSLKWVKNSTLDTPMPKRPCRSEGLIGTWQDEVLLCTASKAGNTWQIPQFDEDPGSVPGDQGTLTQYRLSVPGWCHGTSVPAVLEAQNGTAWRQVPAAVSFTRGSCSAGNGIVSATAELPVGSVVRLRVYVNQWSWMSAPSTLGASRDVTLVYATTVATPSSTRVTTTPLTPVTGIFRLELTSYQWVGDEAVFTFRPEAYTKSIFFKSASNFSTGRGAAPIAGQPISGTWIHFTDQFAIRVKQSGVQWDLNRFEFDINGDDNGVPYTLRVSTDFTWR